MKKVIPINLNGNAFLIEEEGYALLESYFNIAAQRSKNSPDKDSILKDIEQAVANKCKDYLSLTKTVILTDEVKKILIELGPQDIPEQKTDTSDDTDGATAPKTAAPAPKRFRLSHKDSLICGVCSGFAEYFKVNVWVIRVIFIIFAILSRGGLVVIYFLIFFFVPYSDEQPSVNAAPPMSDNIIDTLQEKYKTASTKLKTSSKNISWLSTIWDDFASLISMGGVIAVILLLLILSLLWQFIH